jgi:hypothetical protein
MDLFKEEISSSSGKPYYRNKKTNETQWGFKTYYNTKKPLPKGWVRLNLDGKPLYKYIKKILKNSYSYAPRELGEILPTNQQESTLEYSTETTVSPTILSTRQMNGKQLVEFLLQYQEELTPSDIVMLRMVADSIESEHNRQLKSGMKLYGVHSFVLKKDKKLEDGKHRPTFKKEEEEKVLKIQKQLSKEKFRFH